MLLQHPTHSAGRRLRERNRVRAAAQAAFGGLVLLGLAACGGGDLDGAVPGEPSLMPVTDALNQAQQRGDINGYAIRVERGNNVLLNMSSGNVQTTDSVLIASSIKPIAAAAILAIADSGHVDLDAPIANYLSGRPAGNTQLASEITLRQLLNHTSGLPVQPACIEDQMNTTLENCATSILQGGRTFAAGNFAYGGGGYQVAGYVATVVENRSWGDIVARRIGTPVGMSSLTYGPTANPRVAGGAAASLVDLARFQRMMTGNGNINGQQVLSTATVNRLRTVNEIEGATVIVKPGDVTADGYAFGWWQEDPAEHPGSAGPEISAPGAFGTVPWIDYDRGYRATLVLRQADESTGIELQQTIRSILLDALP
jgi:CubicO group peptidase (beta-lactamase class C family)